MLSLFRSQGKVLLVIPLIHIVFLKVCVVSVCYRLLPFPRSKFETFSFWGTESCLALLQLCSRTIETSVRKGLRESNAYMPVDHLGLPSGCYCFSLCCAACLTWPLLLPVDTASLSEPIRVLLCKTESCEGVLCGLPGSDILFPL